MTRVGSRQTLPWMRNSILFIVVTLVAAEVGCSSGGSKQPCMPPTARRLHWTLTMTSAGALAGEYADVRLVAGGNVYGCYSAAIPSSGQIEFQGSAFGPIGFPEIEAIVSSSGLFVPSSRQYVFVLGTDGSTTSADPCAVDYYWDVPVDLASAPQKNTTWTAGMGCPGT